MNFLHARSYHSDCSLYTLRAEEWGGNLQKRAITSFSRLIFFFYSNENAREEKKRS